MNTGATERSESELAEWLTANGVAPADRIAFIRWNSPIWTPTPEGTVTRYVAAAGKYRTVQPPAAGK